MRRNTWLVCALVASVALLVTTQVSPRPVAARPADTDVVLRVGRVNVSTGGRAANGATFGAVLSASGRYVAFTSAASTLVRRDLNGTTDIFVRDLRTTRTIRLSVASDGTRERRPEHEAVDQRRRTGRRVSVVRDQPRLA